MKYIGIGILLMMGLGACQQSLWKNQIKIDQELEAYRKDFQGESVADVQACWKKDTLLIQLVDSVLLRSMDIKRGFLDIQMVRSQFEFTRGLRKPVVSGIVQPSLRKFGQYTSDGVGNFDTQFSPNITREQKIPEHLPDLQLGFQSSWEVDLWGKLAKKKKSSALRFLATEWGQKWMITSIVSEIASAYGQLGALDKELEILKSNIEIQRKAYELVRIQKEAGVVNESAVQQLEAQWINSQAKEGDIQQEIVQIENQIRYWLNKPNAEIPRTKYPIECPMDSVLLANIKIDQLVNRPDVKQAKMELEAQVLAEESAKLALKPSLVLSGMLGVQGFQPQYLFQLPGSMAYSLIGGLTTPWLNRSGLISEVNFASAKLKSLDLAYQNALLKGYLEWDTQVKSLMYLKNMSTLKQKEVVLTKGAVATVAQLFNLSNANYIEVLMAQQSALGSELELLEIYRKRWMHSIQLYRALGGGW
jgi:outer membrane protein TolC